MVLAAPARRARSLTAIVLQAPLDRDAPCCGCAPRTTAPAAGHETPEVGSVQAGDCLRVVDALSDEALIEARGRLDRRPTGRW